LPVNAATGEGLEEVRAELLNPPGGSGASDPEIAFSKLSAWLLCRAGSPCNVPTFPKKSQSLSINTTLRLLIRLLE
jgi:hypothetical protein